MEEAIIGRLWFIAEGKAGENHQAKREAEDDFEVHFVAWPFDRTNN
jgi:hypothetical protein